MHPAWRIAILGAMPDLYAVPLARRAQAAAITGALGVAVLIAGLAPLVSVAPGWLRVAGVLLFLLGALLVLIGGGLANTVRIERRARRDFDAQIAVDTAAAQVFRDNGALECASDPSLAEAATCGPDGCGGACALAALRRA